MTGAILVKNACTNVIILNKKNCKHVSYSKATIVTDQNS